MSIASHVNTRCLRAACDTLGIPYTIHDAYGNFISVDLGKPYFFVNAATPFNSSAVDKICKDKEFSWKLLNEAVSMPKTKGYFDPHPASEEYAGYVREGSTEEIADDIMREFSLPVIVKMNAGQKGKNVFLCEDKVQILSALAVIFDHSSPSHDYVALAQEYAKPKKEYRVIVFRKEIVLTYEKDISAATFTGNLSPLHYQNAKAVSVNDPHLIQKMQDAINPIFSTLDLEFGGIDIILDAEDLFQIIELNTHPGFTYFVKDNGEEELVGMYERILRQLA